MNTGKLLLKWEDFTEDITASYHTLRNVQDFADVTLACEDGLQVEAHKVILAACSSVFTNILQSQKHPHPLIFLRGLSYNTVSDILDFMYYGEVKIEVEQLNNFLTAAKDLKLKGISSKNEPEAKIVYSDHSNVSENQYNELFYEEDFKVLSTNIKDQNVDIGAKYQQENTFPGYLASIELTQQKTEDSHEYFVIKDIESSMHPSSGASTDLDIDITSSEKNKSDTLISDHNMEDICYECTVCGKLLKSKLDLSYHAEIHLSGFPTTHNTIICPECERVFESKGSLYKHFSIHHKSIKEQKKRQFEELDSELKSFISRNKSIWMCKACGQQFKNQRHLTDHVESRHMDLSIPCSKCGHILKTRVALSRHCKRYCKLSTV